MATSTLLKFLTLKCDISRTIWRIEVSDGSLFCIFQALSFEHNLFFDRTCPLRFRSLVPSFEITNMPISIEPRSFVSTYLKVRKNLLGAVVRFMSQFIKFKMFICKIQFCTDVSTRAKGSNWNANIQMDTKSTVLII